MSIKNKRKNEFAVKLISTYCKGCGLCMEVCPEDKIEIAPNPNERGIHPVRLIEHVPCSGCMRCTAICPEAAIELYRLKIHQPSAQKKEKE